MSIVSAREIVYNFLIKVVNFASKLTFFLVDIKLDDLPDFGKYIAEYLFNLYADEPEMTKRLEKLFKEFPAVAFARLTDRSAIATLNRTQLHYLHNGYSLYKYIENGTLHTRKINVDVNRDWIFTQTTNGKTEHFKSAEKFKELLIERYP